MKRKLRRVRRRKKENLKKKKKNLPVLRMRTEGMTRCGLMLIKTWVTFWRRLNLEIRVLMKMKIRVQMENVMIGRHLQVLHVLVI